MRKIFISKLDGRVFEGEMPDDVDVEFIQKVLWKGSANVAEASRYRTAMNKMPWLEDEERRVFQHRWNHPPDKGH